MNRARLLLAVAAVAAVTAACGAEGDRGPAAAAGWQRQTVEVGRVEIQATPTVVDDTRVEVRLVFDTHTVELGTDIAGTATLAVAGREHRDGRWDGDGPGGHHREGVLRFAAGPSGSEPFELHLAGFSEPVTFRWPPPASGQSS